jgi:hypothetical protein
MYNGLGSDLNRVHSFWAFWDGVIREKTDMERDVT